MNKIDHIGIYGPVDGMGERDLRGDYYLASLTFEDDEFVRGRLTMGQIQELRDLCNGILTGRRVPPSHAPLPGSCHFCKQLPCACARAY